MEDDKHNPPDNSRNRLSVGGSNGLDFEGDPASVQRALSKLLIFAFVLFVAAAIYLTIEPDFLGFSNWL